MVQPNSAVAWRQQELARLVNSGGVHVQVAIPLDELGEITAIDPPVARAATLGEGHPGALGALVSRSNPG